MTLQTAMKQLGIALAVGAAVTVVMVGSIRISKELAYHLLFPGIWIAGVLGEVFQFGVHDSALYFVAFAVDVLFNSVWVFLGIRLWQFLSRNRV